MVSHVYKNDIVVFHEPTYPQACPTATLHELVPGPFERVDAAHLAKRLGAGCKLLISFHGPYFPKASWQALLRFLEGGGNIALFGGMPFACPVNDDGEAELEQDAYTRQLFLGPFFQLTPDSSTLRLVADEDATFLRDCPLTLSGEEPGTFWSFYPKMTQVSDHPEDTGSAGPLDTVLQPLIFALGTTASGERRVATPALVVEQRSGRFKGGRWLISAWRPLTKDAWLTNAEAIRQLLLFAAEDSTLLDVRPALACYQPGETPSLIVQTRTSKPLQARVTLYQPHDGSILQTFDVGFPASQVQQEQSLKVQTLQTPGLYRVRVEYRLQGGQERSLESGFWIWDESLVEATRNKRLTAGRDYFYQEDRIFPVYGTTYMDSRVQRKFLYLPNPARWDSDLTEMKAAGINTIRTGLWTAWREFVPLAGVANEAFLSALDAFVMNVCKQNIQLIFTFFSFFPPLFEGENPWLDPRSVEAQQDFVSLLARRYARVELLSWDLINEPSFGDPAKIFALRPLPQYDRFEIAAFQRWLAERYTLSELQLRWRKTPATLPDWEHVLPPQEEEYTTYVRDNTVRAMLQVADYTHFSQDMFTNWAAQMREALRAGGSQTLVGVGQDEAGTRPSPQFHASAVDYTTTHPWWNIDELLWDMLLDKTLDTPNLIQETGVMLARDLDGRPWRSEQECAYLLERKLITGLVAHSAGLIQWLWHTNSYMTSDNENSIGLVRVDGSIKPELAVMEEFGRLHLALDGRLLERSSPSDIWLVIPYSQWFARPDTARLGTQHAVRVLGYELGIIPQMVSEYQLHALATASPRPRAIIVPAVQLFDREAWRALLGYVHDGGTVLVNGVISRDSHNLPFDPGLDDELEKLAPVPVSRYEELEDAEGRTYQLTFAEEKMSYVKRAHNFVKSYRYGSGTLVWCGLPLELANEGWVIKEMYRRVLDLSLCDEERHTSSPLLVARQPLTDGTLVLVVSESSRVHHLDLDDGIQVSIAPNRAGALIIGSDRTIKTFGGLKHDSLSSVGIIP